jgi:hypothetical protein
MKEKPFKVEQLDRAVNRAVDRKFGVQPKIVNLLQELARRQVKNGNRL